MKARITAHILLLAALAVAGCRSESPIEDAASESRRLTRAEVREWERDHVVVIVNRSNRARVNGTGCAPADLPAKFRDIAAKTPGRPVFLLLQDGADEQADAFVRLHAERAGLGPVERR